MNKIDIIEKILNHSKEASEPYPLTLDKLEQASVTSYIFLISKYDATYFGSFGEWKEPIPQTFQPLTVKAPFHEPAVRIALGRVQTSISTFLQFISEMALAGVSHYRVDVAKRSVTYFDQDEKNFYQEMVPKI